MFLLAEEKGSYFTDIYGTQLIDLFCTLVELQHFSSSEQYLTLSVASKRC